MKFEIFKGQNDKLYFRLKARNGQVILTSQGYSSKAAVKNGIESVQKNCKDSACFEVKEAKNGKPFFNLLATNKQIIGNSQMYASMSSLRSGIDSVQRVAPKARIEDLSGN